MTKQPHIVRIRVYRLQLRTSPCGNWTTIQTGRNREQLLAELYATASPSCQVRLLQGNEQLAIEGGR